MSHREEPREVGGAWPSQQYVVVEPKKKKVLTPEQREAGKTWAFHTEPERPQIVGEKPPTTTILKPPKTYETWLPIQDPERRYVVGTHEPRKTDVTLIKAPPSVRAELRQQTYAEAYDIWASLGEIQPKIYGVQTRLYDIETGLRELSIIQEQRAKGYEFIGKVGVELYFIPKETLGIAETMLSWGFPSYEGPSLMDIISPETKLLPRTATTSEFARIVGITPHPLAPIAGPIASFESPIYSLAQILGIPSPRPPPTFVGGVVGKGLEVGLGWESTELERTMAYGPQYAVGTVLGDIFVSYLLGKAVEKTVVQPISKVWKGSRPEMWLIKHWDWYAKRVATGLTPQVVSYPTPGTVSMKGLEAQQLAWELTLTPRTSLVTIAKVGAKRSIFTFTRGIGYTPMAVTLAKAMSVKEMGGRQALLVIETPALKKLPYLPSLIFKKATTRLPQLFGFGLTFGLKGLPSLVSLPSPISIVKPKRRKKMTLLPFPKLVPRVTPITRMKPFISPIARAKERLIPALVPSLELIQPQIVKQVTIQETMLKQLQIQKISFTPPRLKQIPTIKPPWIPLPRRRVVSRPKRGLRGAWFKRTHPIKTPEQMMRTFYGTPERKRKKRVKAKRVKKKQGKPRKRVKRRRKKR